MLLVRVKQVKRNGGGKLNESSVIKDLIKSHLIFLFSVSKDKGYNACQCIAS